MLKKPKHVSLVEVPRVQFYKNGDYSSSGRLVLHEETIASQSNLWLWAVPEIINVPIAQIPLNSIVQITTHPGKIDRLSSFSLVTKPGDLYEFVFTEGRMIEIISLLQRRKVVIQDEKNDDSYSVTVSDPVLSAAFLLNQQHRQIHSAFSNIELTDRLSADDISTRLTQDGVLSPESLSELNSIFKRKGICEDAIPLIWCYWLKIFKPGQNTLERSDVMRRWSAEYNRGLDFTRMFSIAELDNFLLLKDALKQIEKDVNRTDQLNPFFSKPEMRTQMANIARASLKSNLQLGYCQGMLDCAAVFLQVCKGNQVTAYAMYRNFILRSGNIYGIDPAPLKTRTEKVLAVLQVCKPELERVLRFSQGYIVANAWILACFKRHFPYSTVLQIWSDVFHCTYGRDTLCYLIAAVFIAKSHYILTIENVSDSTVFQNYNTIEDIPFSDIQTIASECRKKYILRRNSKTKYIPE